MRSSFVGARHVRVAALLLSATVFACGGSGSSSAVTGPPPPPSVPSGSTTSLTIANNYFTPSTDSVAVGATATWTWDTCTGDGYGGSNCGSHSVQFDDGSSSSAIKSSGSFSRMFAAAGTFTYHCLVHPEMKGTIVVH